MDTIRLFIAIPLPGTIKEKLSALKFPVENVKWVPEDQLHLTLKFIGELNPESTARLAGELEAIHFQPFQFTLKDTGTFPGSGSPKVIWVGVEAPNELFELQKTVAGMTEKNGAKVDHQPFIPHITLARVKKKGMKRSRFKPILNSDRPEIFGTVNVDQFILYKSILKRDGAKHIAIRKYQAVN